MMTFFGVVGHESPSGGVGRLENGWLEFGGGISTLIEERSRGSVIECVEDARAGAGRLGSGMEARPALMPTDV